MIIATPVVGVHLSTVPAAEAPWSLTQRGFMMLVFGYKFLLECRLRRIRLGNCGVRPGLISVQVHRKGRAVRRRPCPKQAVRSDNIYRWGFRPGIGWGLIDRSFEGSAAVGRRKHSLPGNAVWKNRTAAGRFLCAGEGTGCQSQNGRAKGGKFEADPRGSGWTMTESKKSLREIQNEGWMKRDRKIGNNGILLLQKK